MKRLLLAVALAALALAATLGYASHRREQAYRRLVEQGDAALTRGESVAAAEAFTVAIALKPGSMLGYLKRGEAYRQYGELGKAVTDLRTASQLDPSATRPLELLGDVEHALGRYDRATNLFARYVRIDDRSPKVLYKLALAHYFGGDSKAAIAALQSALAIDSTLAEAHYLMGLCFEALRNPDEARAALTRALELAPALLHAREALAELHRRTSRDEDRLFQLEALQALDPASPARQVTLALAHADAGQFERALTVLGRTAERFPTSPYTYVALGRVWLDVAHQRDDAVALQKAIEALERAVSAEGSSEAGMLLGQALLQAGQPERAAAVLMEATSKRPVEPLAFYHLADAAERIGNLPAARGALLDYHALAGDPADARRRARLFDRIATLSARVGEPAAAVTWFERAAGADPSQVDAGFLVRVADAQWRAGNTERARESAAQALQRDPENRAARTLLRRLGTPSSGAAAAPAPTGGRASGRRDPEGRRPEN